MGHYQSLWGYSLPRPVFRCKESYSKLLWVSFLNILFPAASLLLGAAPSTNVTLSIPLPWQLLVEAWSIFFSRFQLKKLGDKVAASRFTQLLTQPHQTLPPYPISCICFWTLAPQWLLPQKYNIVESRTKVLWGNCFSLVNCTWEKEVNRTELSLLHAHEFTASTN